MSAAVLLTTMRCNISCAHCSVDAHPHRDERMPLEEGLAYVRGLARSGRVRNIDLSGGEPLIHMDDVKQIAREARRLGLGLRITSNGFWAGSPSKAERVLGELVDAGVSSVGLSIDVWHMPFVSPSVIGNYVAACRTLDLQPLVSAVVRGAPSAARRGEPPEALRALLVDYGLDTTAVISVERWEARRAALAPAEQIAFERHSRAHWVLVAWQILTAEGRGRDLDPVVEAYGKEPPEPCPAAGTLPTIDAEGRLFPCCSPWTARKDFAFGVVTEQSLPDDLERLRRSALVRLLHDLGPETLIRALRTAGVPFDTTHSGICNQCGQLLDRLSLDQLEAAAATLLARDARLPLTI